MLSFYHHKIDPLEQLHVRALEKASIETINCEVLTLAADRGKSQASSLEGKVSDALADAEALQLDLERGNGAAALKNIET